MWRRRFCYLFFWQDYFCWSFNIHILLKNKHLWLLSLIEICVPVQVYICFVWMLDSQSCRHYFGLYFAISHLQTWSNNQNHISLCNFVLIGDILLCLKLNYGAKLVFKCFQWVGWIIVRFLSKAPQLLTRKTLFLIFIKQS